MKKFCDVWCRGTSAGASRGREVKRGEKMMDRESDRGRGRRGREAEGEQSNALFKRRNDRDRRQARISDDILTYSPRTGLRQANGK